MKILTHPHQFNFLSFYLSFCSSFAIFSSILSYIDSNFFLDIHYISQKSQQFQKKYLRCKYSSDAKQQKI